MREIEIIIQPDGSLLLNRGDAEHNAVMMELVDALCSNDNKESLQHFFSFVDENEQVFGDGGMCG